jgi:integrase
MTPEKVKKAGYSAYQTGDIQKMLGFCGRSKRNRALIHFLASTGCRVGAIHDLRLKHVTQEDDSKSVLFYEGSNEEYYGFLTHVLLTCPENLFFLIWKNICLSII